MDADGILYQDPDGPDAGGYWQFAVHANHTVNFSVVTKNSPGATKVYHSNGWILIDPDGFVFDVTKGLDVISSTVTGVPTEVGNTIAGVTVTAMVSMPTWGGWVPWPAYLYNDQVNPQVTGDDGYSLFSPRPAPTTSRSRGWTATSRGGPGRAGDHRDRTRQRPAHPVVIGADPQIRPHRKV